MFCDAQNRHTKSSLLIGSSMKLPKQCQALLNKKSQKMLEALPKLVTSVLLVG